MSQFTTLLVHLIPGNELSFQNGFLIDDTSSGGRIVFPLYKKVDFATFKETAYNKLAVSSDFYNLKLTLWYTFGGDHVLQSELVDDQTFATIYYLSEHNPQYQAQIQAQFFPVPQQTQYSFSDQMRNIQLHNPHQSQDGFPSSYTDHFQHSSYTEQPELPSRYSEQYNEEAQNPDSSQHHDEQQAPPHQQVEEAAFGGNGREDSDNDSLEEYAPEVYAILGDVSEEDEEEHDELVLHSEHDERVLESDAGFVGEEEWNRLPFNEQEEIVEYWREGDDPRTGVYFKSKAQFVYAIRTWLLKNNREMYLLDSRPEAWKAICFTAGPKFQDDEHRYPCEWTARGSNRNSKGLWKLARWNPRHTCVGSVVRNNNRSLSASMIATKIGHQIKLDLTYKVKHIIATAKDHWNVDVSYCKAWNARRIAIERLYGTWESNFAELPAYIDELVQENPGTIVRWLHGQKENQDSPETFRYVFWAFGPNIQAFKHCIPYVVVDGTHLKGNYRGKLLTAVTKNENGNILPLAFAMVDNESNDSWLWFLSNFREHVAVIHKEEALCVISDRHAGLINAMAAMDGWHHRYCLRHIRSNIMTTFKDVKLKRWCWQVGTATQRRKYIYAITQVKEIKPEAWDWLKAIGLSKWTLMRDKDYVRWGNTTSNIAESYNNVIRTVRMMPIKACIEGTFNLSRAHFVQNFEKSRGCNSPLATAMWNLYTGRESYATHQGKTPFDISKGIYECRTNDPTSMGGENTYRVDFPERSCTCGKWQMQRIACSHAIAVDGYVNAPTRRNHEAAPIMAAKWYSADKWRKQYNAQFRPLRHIDYWKKPEWTIVADSRMIITKRGRKKQRRIRNEMDQPSGSASGSRVRHCSGCGQTGHNSRSQNCPLNRN